MFSGCQLDLCIVQNRTQETDVTSTVSSSASQHNPVSPASLYPFRCHIGRLLYLGSYALVLRCTYGGLAARIYTYLVLLVMNGCAGLQAQRF